MVDSGIKWKVSVPWSIFGLLPCARRPTSSAAASTHSGPSELCRASCTPPSQGSVRRIQPTFVLVGRAEECKFQEGPCGRVHDGVCRPEGTWRKVVVLPDFHGREGFWTGRCVGVGDLRHCVPRTGSCEASHSVELGVWCMIQHCLAFGFGLGVLQRYSSFAFCCCDHEEWWRQTICGSLRRAHLQRRNDWSNEVFDSISWPAYRSASAGLTDSLRTFVVKFSHGWLPVGVRERRCSGTTDIRPQYSKSETVPHLYRCQSRAQWRNRLVIHLQGYLKEAKTAPGLRCIIIKGIESWFITGDTNDPESSETIAQIGWFQVLKEYIPEDWTSRNPLERSVRSSTCP
jgi:hypothetical protein